MDDVCIYSKYYTHTHRECDEGCYEDSPCCCCFPSFFENIKKTKKRKEGKQLFFVEREFVLRRSRREKREDPKDERGNFLKKTDILVSNSYV